MKRIEIVVREGIDEEHLMASITCIVDGDHRGLFPRRKVAEICKWQLDSHNDWFATLVRKGDALYFDELPVESDTLYLWYRYDMEPLKAIKPWLKFRFTPKVQRRRTPEASSTSIVDQGE